MQFDLTVLFHMERIFVVSIVQLLVTAFFLAQQTHSYRIIVTEDSFLSEDGERSSSMSDNFVVKCQREDLFAGSCVDQRTVKVTTEVIGNSDGISCTNVQLEATDCSTDEVEVCYNLTTSHWYGGTAIRVLRWPLDNQVAPSLPYVTDDAYSSGYGGVQERYWFNSNGLGIYVDWESPLWVSINGPNNSGLFCLRGRYLDSPYVNDDRAAPSLNITECQGRDARHVHDYMSATYFRRPSGIPDEGMFRDPIWSTWAQYKASVDQNKVLEFADAILSNGFNCSQLEIDDRWETFYGDLQFDPVKFPNPRVMVDGLRARGLRTTLWVHPFINIDSPALIEAVSRRIYVGDPATSRVQQQPAFTRWWQGSHSITIDFTDPSGSAWFKDKLTALQLTYGINSFKFDAGETNWLPSCYRFSQLPPSKRNPSYYSTVYAELAYSIDNQVRQLEVRVGAQAQHLPIFVRMMDKDSRWGYNNGLSTLIPHALTYGLIGYPFVLPDMVGGNGYVVLPNRELFIRWTQVNVFLPSLQFSIAPWQYDSELVRIVNKMMAIRARYVQVMINLARESTITGAPIVRPLWWIAPNDTDALTVDDEFLLGDDLLAAPVVQQGATSRDIYLPAGRWRDELRNEDIDGGRWYNGYRVELDELAYFTKI